MDLVRSRSLNLPNISCGFTTKLRFACRTRRQAAASVVVNKLQDTMYILYNRFWLIITTLILIMFVPDLQWPELI